MLYFAYDGSINGDWVSHYATHLAAAHSSRQLNLIHVRSEEIGAEDFEQKRQRIATECKRLDITLQVQIFNQVGSIFDTICANVPAGPESFLVCGTRVRKRKRGYLRGTISEHFLHLAYCNVLAVRVVHPGMLGLPRRLLLPVSGHPRGFRSGRPFLELFGPQLSHMFILHVLRHGRSPFLRLVDEPLSHLRVQGEAYCQRVEQEIADGLGLNPSITDAHVVIGDDIAHEIVIAATKTRSRLIYIGACERNMTSRIWHGDPVENVLRNATCDVAVYRGAR